MKTRLLHSLILIGLTTMASSVHAQRRDGGPPNPGTPSGGPNTFSHVVNRDCAAFRSCFREYPTMAAAQSACVHGDWEDLTHGYILDKQFICAHKHLAPVND